MCRAVTCRSCGKASWAGCGAHVEQVLAGVPQSKRCHCQEEAAAARAEAKAAKAAAKAESGGGGLRGWLRR